MTVRDVHDILNAWAPKETAWERDNVGLQVGSMARRVRTILVALDMTDEVLAEARDKKVDLIVTHHPLLFHPAGKVTLDDRVGRLVYRLAESGIALYSAHTNLDAARGGVSFALAGRLRLQEPEFLEQDRREMKKIAVFVPPDHVDAVMAAMAAAGAGTLGKYEMCSFRVGGTGTFRPAKGAKPFTGAVGTLEATDEVRLEMILPAWRLHDVVAAMRKAHPYEEVAYDAYDLSNPGGMAGLGVIGNLAEAMPLSKFLAHVKRALRVPSVRYSGPMRRSIRRVAACGGSGSGLMATAIRRGADAFVTADVTYHQFQECDGRLALIDAGHWETEEPVIPGIVGRLQSNVRGGRDRVKVLQSRRMKNFVQYYTS
jgi:dinuclear metal center YbgI/SA1388 family protein